MQRLTTFAKMFLITVGLFLIGGALFSGKGCNSIFTDEKNARRVVKNAGYKGPISVGGYGWYKCSEDDFTATNFTAWNADSTERVSGCVCAGVFKGSTIRMD